MSPTVQKIMPKTASGWTALLSSLPLLWGTFLGAVSECQKIPALHGICGTPVGIVEQVNMQMGPKYLMANPTTQITIYQDDEHVVRAKVFDDGVVAVFAQTHDRRSEGGYRQQLLFITPETWEDVLSTQLSLPSVLQQAYAGDTATPPPMDVPFHDAIIEHLGDGWVRIQRVYTNGCIDTFALAWV